MQTTTYRGIFVNDADTIVGIPLEEAKLIKFVKQFQRNSVRFYDLSSILSTSGGRTKMRALNVLLRQNGVQWVGAQRTGSSTQLNLNVTIGTDYIANTYVPNYTTAASNHSSDNTKSFNEGCATDSEKFNTIGQEQEFWQPLGHANLVPFDKVCAENREMFNYAKPLRFSKDMYIGQIRNQLSTLTYTPTQISRTAVKFNNRILLTCYVTATKLVDTNKAYLSIKPELELLGKAATWIGKKIDVAILFNCKTNNIDGSGAFFQAGGTPEQAFGYIQRPYDLDNFTGKAGLNLVGEDLYGYRELKNLIV